MVVTSESSDAEVLAWLRETAAVLLVPDADLTVSQWADEFRVLPRASAEPGQWRTDRTPYLREIMDALSVDSPYEWVIFRAGSQVGKTECGLNWLGYLIDRHPSSIMVVWPTLDSIKDNIRIRIDPLIESTPALRGKVGERVQDKGKGKADNLQMKEFPGGFAAFAASNSTAALKSKPIRYLLLDEPNEYPRNANQQGNPITLAEARTQSFGSSRKIFMCSTPTNKGASVICEYYETTDMRRYYVPCPHCGGYQTLVWEQMRYDPTDIDIAHYQCRFCGERIYNHHKTQMLAEGEWRAEGESENPRKVGFHISSLYSPVGMLSWSECMRKFREAQGDTQKLKAWTNTVLGESYEESGERPEWERLYNRREEYEIGCAPDGVLLVTAGVDVQKDRIEAEVVGWGRGKESWSLGYYVFEGDTSDLYGDAWNGLRDLLTRGFVHQETGVVLNIRKAGLDSGYATTTVYQFGREQKEKVVVLKGQDSGDVPVGQPRFVDVKIPGSSNQVIKRGLAMRPVATTMLKHELYGWLRLERPEGPKMPPGYCHFPQFGSEYFKQLTAEQWVTTEHRASKRITGEFKKIRERNEALDARVYARAAAAVLNIDIYQEHHWDRLEQAIGSVRDPRQEATSDGPADRESRHRRYRSRGIQ